MRGRFAVVEALRAEGVRYVFGNPGTTESPLMDALDRAPDLKYILAAQEGVAMGMADGYARASGEVPFVNLHIDTGLSNGLSLLFNAYAGGTPLVLSSVNASLSKMADYRTDLAGLTAQFTKWGAEVTHADQIPSVMRRAFAEARTPPTGPTFVGFAPESLDSEAEISIAPRSDTFVRAGPDPRAVETAAAALADAQRPLMVVGDRVSQFDAVDAAVAVAERLGARVYGAGYAEMTFPTGHPQWIGQLPPYARLYPEQLRAADVVLAVGCKVFHDFFDLPTNVLAPDATLIHMDCNASEINRSQPTDLGILCDPRAGLEALAEALDAAFDPARREAARERAGSIGAETAARRAATLASLRECRTSRPMPPLRMMHELAQAAPADTVIVDDSISARPILHEAFEFSRPGSMHSERAGGAIGWGMGAALGVKLAEPDRPVLGVIGDGSAMLSAQALWTASAYEIPAVYAICNNGGYRVLKVNLHAYFEEVLGEPDRPTSYLGMDLPQEFDLGAIAKAMGVASERIEDPERIGPAFQRALDSGKPALLDVIIDGAL
ncbi:MAG: thiamine pyrophosphate-binding protein [Chloroflexi bacterium]|nr:thiamine pyrophosphate-binding protein [Chloroflexota bacterium]